MVKILVTGGAGYVGSHTVVEILNAGFEVVVIDNLVNAYQGRGSKPESLCRVEKISGKKVAFHNVDLLNREALDEVLSMHEIDCVMHFAALKAVGESVQKPLEYYKNNVSGSINLFEVMKSRGIKKVVYSSSATVYGTPQELPLKETHPTGKGCTNPYGKSKYFVEEILQDLVNSDQDWCVISLRYFNPVGAHSSGIIGEDPRGPPNNLMPYIAQVAVGKRDVLSIYGADYDTPDGTGVRDYIHIEDLALGHIAAAKLLLEAKSNIGFKTYNLGTGKGYSVLEVVKAFEQASGRNIPYKICPRRPGDISTSYADPSLAQHELGWKANKDLLSMCRDSWNWQSMNPRGFITDEN